MNGIDISLYINYIELAKVSTAKYWSQRLDIPGYILTCSQMDLNIFDWIGLKDDPFVQKYGLPDPIKEALKYEASEAGRAQKEAKDKEIAGLKLGAQQPNSGLGLGDANVPLSRTFR